MFDWFFNLVLPTETPNGAQSMVTIFLVVALGVLVGRIKIGKVSFGVSAVMFVGLILGHYGYKLQEDLNHFIRDFGLILFVYGVGIQVGPSFFSSFKKEGLKLNFIAVSTVFFGAFIAIIIHKVSGLGIENVVGIMSGAVTNTPGLGAAKSTLVELQGYFSGKEFMDPAVGYAINYPLGVFGIIGFIILSKTVLKVNPEIEMRLYRMKKINREYPPVYKKCRVTNKNAFGKSISDLIGFTNSDVVITRVKQSGDSTVFLPSLETILYENDVVMVTGLEKEVDRFIESVGRLSSDLFIESSKDILSVNIAVTKMEATHKTIAELDLMTKYDLKCTKVLRAGNVLLARPSLELFYGDLITVVGTKDSIKEAKKVIGHSEKKLLEPDFLSIFGGLILGILVGSIPIVIPTLPIPIKLGFAAGPLLIALFISRYGGFSFIHSYINSGAVHFIKDLGICLFFAAVGISAGGKFYANFVEYNGWLWLFYGSFITFIPILYLVIMAKFVLKLNFLQITGLMSGAYTDPAALSFSTSYLDSDIPIQAYAIVYPLVTISRIFVAQVLILLFI